MRRIPLFLLLALPLALVPLAALAQKANPAEVKAVSEIAECIAPGLPEGWARARVEVELDKPGDDTGNVRYIAEGPEARDVPIAFTPCDVRKPAQALIELRKSLSPERRGWTLATLLIHADGRFELKYTYPDRK